MQFEKVSKDAFASDMKKTYYSTYRGAEDIDFLIDKAYERISTPVRKTKRSAGYDFFIPVSVGLMPGEKCVVPSGEGDIMIALWNTSKNFQQIVSGTRCCQGIFEIHGLTADDNADGERVGGLGSTGL